MFSVEAYVVDFYELEAFLLLIGGSSESWV
jgi:hypothetical protein